MINRVVRSPETPSGRGGRSAGKWWGYKGKRLCGGAVGTKTFKRKGLECRRIAKKKQKLYGNVKLGGTKATRGDDKKKY